MKKIFNRLFVPLASLVLLAACKKDPVLTYLDVVPFPDALTASATDLALAPSNDDSSVITLSWPAVTFKIAAPVTYKLQLDVPTDTIGSNAWANATTIEIGNDVLAKSFNGAELNTIALTALGLASDSVHTIVARIVATLDRPVYSNAVAFNVKPYKLTVLNVLYLPGDYQGWNPSAASIIREYPGKPKKYEGYVHIPAGGTYQFKMTPQPDWTPTAYGDATGTSGDIIVANYAGGNMSVPDGGYYYITADLATNKWTATKTTWSIIGDATPGGWGSDTQLTYDAANKVWKVTADMNAGGSFKFRANNAWTLDFGIDGGTKQLLYADNPFLGYTPDLWNLSVPETGNYTITLNLQDPGKYTYDLHKN